MSGEPGAPDGGRVRSGSWQGGRRDEAPRNHRPRSCQPRARRPARRAAPPTALFAEVVGALEAHAIAPCEPQDWTAEMRFEGSFYASRRYAREERDRRIRLVMVAGCLCPEREAFASEDD
jgi:hypothetical protein